MQRRLYFTGAFAFNPLVNLPLSLSLTKQGIYVASDLGYFKCMESLYSLTKNNLIVLAAEHAAREQSTKLVAHLALGGYVTVLDNGNRFQPYELARAIRKQTRDVEKVATRVFIRRAFTCYQTLALLESTPELGSPYIILDLLANFYDENIGEKEIDRVFSACAREVLRMKHNAPVVITLAPPRLLHRGILLERVYQLAEQVMVDLPEKSIAAHRQLGLFSETVVA